MEELDIISMDVDENNIKTNDNYILNDLLKKRIEHVPFYQDIDEKQFTNLNMSLNISNMTDESIKVFTKDIIVSDGKKQLENKDFFSTSICLIKLKSTKKLEVNNIKLVRGKAKQNAGKFCSLANISYEILDVEPLNETKYKTTGVSSLVSNPAHFKLGYTTHRNIEPKKIMLMCCDSIINRIENISFELNKISKEQKSYVSDLIEMEVKNDQKLIHLKGEYWTIGKLISKYCFLEFKEIKFVSDCIEHPSIEKITIKIIHDDYIKLITNALKSIINDVKIVKKPFMDK